MGEKTKPFILLSKGKGGGPVGEFFIARIKILGFLGGLKKGLIGTGRGETKKPVFQAIKFSEGGREFNI